MEKFMIEEKFYDGKIFLKDVKKIKVQEDFKNLIF